MLYSYWLSWDLFQVSRCVPYFLWLIEFLIGEKNIEFLITKKISCSSKQSHNTKLVHIQTIGQQLRAAGVSVIHQGSHVNQKKEMKEEVQNDSTKLKLKEFNQKFYMSSVS